MRSLLIITLLAASLITTAQSEKLYDVMPMSNGTVTYSEVIQADSTAASVLYDRAHKWFVSAYGSAQDVIQLANGETIIGKGYFTQMFGGAMAATKMEIWHTVKIRVKDGRWRYEITDFNTGDASIERWADAANKYMPRKVTDFLQRADAHVVGLIASLSAAMSEPEPDEW